MIRLLLMCLFLASSTHDIHFTKSTIDYNEETRTLQAVINVFTDDLELAIEINNEGLDLEIGGEKQHVLTDSLVGRYALSNINITTSDTQLRFSYIGFEYDYDICYLYLESEPFSLDSVFQVNVSYFYELYQDQENIVDISTPWGKDGALQTVDDPLHNIIPKD